MMNGDARCCKQKEEKKGVKKKIKINKLLLLLLFLRVSYGCSHDQLMSYVATVRSKENKYSR
jgi:hypothetical protein